jgi:hypothetical protein
VLESACLVLGAERRFVRSAVRSTDVTRAGRALPRTGEVLNCGSNSIIDAIPSTLGAHTHELPWLHVPLPVDGQSEKSQTKPHSPQLNGSVWMLTHSLLQEVCSGDRQVSQVPVEQMSFDPQTLPQVPQLL